ncbi:MAG: DUF4398 domain-containing protein [Gammaproteobacteria bacterium]
MSVLPLRLAWRATALAGIALLGLALAGCAAPPVQTMSNARQAVQAAKAAGAPRYAPRIYAEAVHWLDDAEYALKTGHYARAHTSAKHAEQAARAAILAARKAHSPAPATRLPPAGSGSRSG